MFKGVVEQMPKRVVHFFEVKKEKTKQAQKYSANLLAISLFLT